MLKCQNKERLPSGVLTGLTHCLQSSDLFQFICAEETKNKRTQNRLELPLEVSFCVICPENNDMIILQKKKVTLNLQVGYRTH